MASIDVASRRLTSAKVVFGGARFLELFPQRLSRAALGTICKIVIGLLITTSPFTLSKVTVALGMEWDVDSGQYQVDQKLYDLNGPIKSIVVRESWQNAPLSISFRAQFDRNGNYISQGRGESNCGMTIYQHNERGYRITEQVYDNEKCDRISATTNYLYSFDATGRVTKRSQEKGGRVVVEGQFSYDGTGNVARYSETNAVFNYDNEYTYSRLFEPRKMTRHMLFNYRDNSVSFDVIRVKTYDKNDRLIEEINDPVGVMCCGPSGQFVYDEKGLLLKRISLENNGYEWKYEAHDAFGNWTKETLFQNGIMQRLTLRELTYY